MNMATDRFMLIVNWADMWIEYYVEFRMDCLHF
jgi:hypothetical protein